MDQCIAFYKDKTDRMMFYNNKNKPVMLLLSDLPIYRQIKSKKTGSVQSIDKLDNNLLI
jgi:hypothetical protein